MLAQRDQDMYQSDDSFEERFGNKKKTYSEKQLKKQDDLASHIAKIQSKASKAALEIKNNGLDITPHMAHNKKN